MNYEGWGGKKESKKVNFVLVNFCLSNKQQFARRLKTIKCDKGTILGVEL